MTDHWTQIIERAVKNGWKNEEGIRPIQVSGSAFFTKEYLPSHIFFSVEETIFDPEFEFVKAFFGEEFICSHCGSKEKNDKGEDNYAWDSCGCEDGNCNHKDFPIACLVCEEDDEGDLIVPMWKLKIQQLALSTDREQYLWNFMKGL